MISELNILLILLLPLCAFVLIALFGKKMQALSGIASTVSLFVSTLLSVGIAYDYFFVSGSINGIYQKIIPFEYNWLPFSENFSINIGALIDPISVMMLVVVSFISLMVHVYSIGYMKGEERYATYFSYLSLFTFSMLGLVIASNIFQMYIFWELVGISSYLLIGYYFQKPSAVAAAKKAFIVTRFADLGFLVGILVLSFYGESFDFITLIERLTNPQSEQLNQIISSSFIGVSALSWGLILVFMGGAGKSAMFPLHIWLPDAMEGPTPVSALIHAATMVVAGVFLVARLFPVFALSCPIALDVVCYTGIFSSLFAAIIACTQTDIKRVLAYSTMSQIGFMMFSLGVSGYGSENGLGYTASLFHLFTHAMFKALLFLCAGSIIHYVHNNEITAMGGLLKKMPITHFSFLIACFAISGLPPFAGFFSKEEILSAAYSSNHIVFAIALFTSMLTAFYMFRLYFLIFWNKPSSIHSEHSNHGESPMNMLIPLVILSACSILAGFVSFGNFVSSDGAVLPSEFHFLFSIFPVSLALLGIGTAALFYYKLNNRTDKVSQQLSIFYQSAKNKFYVDEAYLFITRSFIFNGIGKFSAWFDQVIINGAINGIALVSEVISSEIRPIQSGKLQHYVLLFFVGLMLFAFIFIYTT
jgi:NADH-quinone oxidoreductase subunit L